MKKSLNLKNILCNTVCLSNAIYIYIYIYINANVIRVNNKICYGVILTTIYIYIYQKMTN